MTFQMFTPREYLQIDIANNWGQDNDKKTWSDRLSWFQANQHQLRELVQFAEEPALFYAGVLAWEDVLAGNPIGYMISLDATSSGLQLLAALTGDRKAAELCNVVSLPGSDNQPRRMDAYTAIYDDMLSQVNDTAKIDRSDVKQSVMTAFYGSTAMPKRVFGEGALLDVFHTTMQRRAPGPWEMNEAFLAMWDPTAYSHDWVLPDNFHVHVKVMNQVKEVVHFLNQPFDVYRKVNEPIEQGRSLSANAIHSIDGMIVRELTRRCSYDLLLVQNLKAALEDPSTWDYSTETEDDQMVLTLWRLYNDSGYLSARILQHLNVNNLGHVDAGVIRELLDSLPEKPFKVIAIHDAFRVLPTYGNDLRRQYNIQLQLIAKSKMLPFLISQIVGRPVHVGKLDPNLHIEIIDTDYALS
jgi:hypothetical protein